MVRINSELRRQRLRFAYRAGPPITNILSMKAFDFLSAVTELGISNDAYALFTKGAIPNGSDMAAVWGDSEDGRDLITKIKDTPAACVQTENQFIFIYEME